MTHPGCPADNPGRQETFGVRLERLTRTVRLPDGREYRNACTLRVLEEVAWYVGQPGHGGVTVNALWRALPGLPYTQIHVALAFLADQGLIQRAGRRTYPLSGTLYEHALASFFYLAEHGG